MRRILHIALRGLQENGFAMFREMVSPDEAARLRAAIERADLAARSSCRGGVRDLLSRLPEARELAAGPMLRELASAVLGARSFVVRGILFDKSPAANWKVVWHQDLTIAVRERRDVDGYTAWSVKDGIPHVQPPAEVMERMVTLRLHLEDCGPENGPLRVIPGSHRCGRLSPSQIEEWRGRVPEQPCLARLGDVLMMRPLLLHASSAAAAPRHRRVIHLEYAVGGLPGELKWYEDGTGPR